MLALEPGEDDILVVDSFLEVVKAATEKHRNLLYDTTQCSVERLLWCLQIVREESVMIPDLTGKLGDEHDEMILFLECARK